MVGMGVWDRRRLGDPGWYELNRNWRRVVRRYGRLDGSVGYRSNICLRWGCRGDLAKNELRVVWRKWMVGGLAEGAFTWENRVRFGGGLNEYCYFLGKGTCHEWAAKEIRKALGAESVVAGRRLLGVHPDGFA